LGVLSLLSLGVIFNGGFPFDQPSLDKSLLGGFVTVLHHRIK
jgi:hypothetical protein